MNVVGFNNKLYIFLLFPIIMVSRRESLEAMERGVTNLPDLDGSLAMKREMMLADGSLGDGERRKYGQSTTPECLIFPRI